MAGRGGALAVGVGIEGGADPALGRGSLSRERHEANKAVAIKMVASNTAALRGRILRPTKSTLLLTV